MGGTTSKYDETDWNNADGHLTEPQQTLDGQPPLSSQQTIYLHKKALNQREYDITDADSNLLFTTRQVPGTICAFDVLARGMDEYVLRVTVDLARRYWIVHRYGEPTFAGQTMDQEATIKAAEDLADHCLLQPIKLYKKCCITVSWSRYLAVAAFYGPPTVDMFLEAVAEKEAEKSKDAEQEGYAAIQNDMEIEEEEDMFSQASAIASRMKTRTRTTSEDSSSVVGSPRVEGKEESKEAFSTEDAKAGTTAVPPTVQEEEGATQNSSMPRTQSEPAHLASPDQKDSKKTLNASVSSVSLDSSRHTAASAPITTMDNSINSDTATTASPTTTESHAQRFANESAAKMRTWFHEKKTVMTERMKERKNKVLHATTVEKHPLDGVLHLDDKPLLLCQEIYNRLIGNHQTSVVTKEQVLQLLKQDAAQHVKDRPKEADADDDKVEEPLMAMDGHEVHADGTEDAPGDGVEECKEESITRAAGVEDEKKTDGGTAAVAEEQQGDEKKVDTSGQPIVGYWRWEHSLKHAKMTMQLAKGTDLALHVVMAILVNQVRYERNAIAMTI